jgi:hypothetical protein
MPEPRASHRRARLGPGSALAAVAAAAGLAVPAAAPAAVTTFGSDLRAPANKVEAHQADTVYFHSALSGGGQVRVPADGQVTSVRIKGLAERRADLRAVKSPPPHEYAGSPLFHVQVLKPQADGTFKVATTSSDFHLPTSGDPEQVTTFTSQYRLCVNRGDVIAFNHIGGWDGIVDQTGPYPMGTPLRVFSTGVPGAVTTQFSSHNGTMDGATIGGAPVAGEELLMQMVLGTGPDANQVCPGGTQGSQPAPRVRLTVLSIPATKIGFSRKGRGTVAVFCRTGSAGRLPCSGTLKVRAYDKKRKKRVTLARASFRELPAGATSSVKLRLTRSGRRTFRNNKRRFHGRVVAVTRPGGPEYTRVARVRVGRRGVD